MIDLDTLIRDADPARDLFIPEVDRSEIRRLTGPPPRQRGRLVDALAAGVAIAVAVGVGVALIVLLAGSHGRASLTSAGRVPTPAAAEPLARILGVLRRPQTAADRAVEPKVRWANPVMSLVRLAATTPWGQQVVLVPQRARQDDTLALLVSGGLARGVPHPAIAGYGGTTGITPDAIEAGDGALMLVPASGRARGSTETSLFMVVPDGVAKVSFVIPPKHASGSVSGWTAYAPLPTVTVPVHNNIAYVQLHEPCCGGVPETRWYAPDGRLIKPTGKPGGSVRGGGQGHSLGPPAINLPPGVVTVAQLREPDGTPFKLTLQRIRFEGRQYVCLAVTQGPGTASQCEGPLPLPDRPLVAVMGDPTVCKPHPAQLVWGLALTNISVAIRSGGREHIGTRRSIPAELRARGNVFYAWARLAPDSLVARNANGQAVETYPINTASVPVFAAQCKHPPTSGQGSTLPQIQPNQP